MATKTGHTPSYPQYFPKSFPRRRLFLLENRNLIDSDGCVTRISDLDELVTFLFDNNALVFVSSLTNKMAFSWLGNAIGRPHVEVPCTKKGVPTSLIFRHASTSRKIIPYGIWKEALTDGSGLLLLDCEFLRTMEEIYRYCEVGSPGTPSALGSNLILSTYTQYTLQRHRAPNKRAQRFLWERHFGGRCDTPGLGNSYEVAIELDMSSAYLAHFLEHPDGTSQPVIGEGAWQFPQFFVECIIEVPHELPLGPFPVRRTRGRIEYPQYKGRYTTALWRNQVEDCLHLGLRVQIIAGWGWGTVTTDNAYWAKRAYRKRLAAGSGIIERAIKAAIVGAIGRFGMHSRFFHLVSEENRTAEDRLVVDDMTHEATYWFIQEYYDYSIPAMTHWYGYTLAECARSLFWYSLPYAEQGTLIATNYDALLINAVDPPTGIVEKHSLASKMCEMGDLRWQRLTNVKVKAPRWIDCDQKKKHPGEKRRKEA